MKTYKFNPEDYKFSPTANYPELGDYFGSDTFVKVVAGGGEDGHYWYCAVKFITDERYRIYKGSFTKGEIILENEYPLNIYLGLISSKAFGEELLKNLLGTGNNDVQKVGAERLKMDCLYKSKK